MEANVIAALALGVAIAALVGLAVREGLTGRTPDPDLASLRRHHGARAACRRAGQVPPPGGRTSNACPAPYDWASE